MTVTLANSKSGEDWRDRPETDFYPTPVDVTVALLDYLEIPKGTSVWEPACGDGRMVDVLRAFGYNVRYGDIQTGSDFLEQYFCPERWIITNPPFIAAEKFIRHAAKIGKNFAFLLKSQYWHAAERRYLFRAIRPQFILPLTWRPDFLFGSKSAAPTMEVIWTVWMAPHTNQTIYEPLARPNLSGSLF